MLRNFILLLLFSEFRYPLFPAEFLAQTLLPFARFRSKVLAEVLRLEYLANLHFCSPVERRFLQPLDGFFHRAHLPQPESGDQLLRFRKWTVNYSSLNTLEPYPLSLRTR